MDKASLKKNIISKTVLFLIIMILVVMFTLLFGEDNTLVGVTTVITILMSKSSKEFLNTFRN